MVLSVFFAALVTIAQVMPPAQKTTDGITVYATGTASAAATSADVTVHVAAAPRLTFTAADLQPFIDAIVNAGVPRANVALPPYLTPGVHVNSTEVTFTVIDPTTAMLQKGIANMAGALAGSTVSLTNAQVMLHLANCAPVMERAQDAALARAKTNARTLAAQLGVHLGSVQSVDARSFNQSATGDCITSMQIGPYNSQPLTLSDFLQVKVSSSISIRYAIAR